MLLKYLFNFERLTLKTYGGIAQLGEHLPCTQGVKSSNLLISTIAYESEHITNLEN